MAHNFAMPPHQRAELDALSAAPNHHRLAFENESFRVLETRVVPGETVPLHTHCWGGVLYVLSWSEFIRRDPEGNILLDSREAGVELDAGQAIWSGPLGPHTLENVGTRPLHVVAFELKEPS